MDFALDIPIGLKLNAWTPDGRMIESAGFKGIPEGTTAKLWALDQQGPGGHMLARIVGEVTSLGDLPDLSTDAEISVSASATIMGDDFGIRIANLVDRGLLQGVSVDLGDDYVVAYIDEYDAETGVWSFKVKFIDSSVVGFTLVDKPAFPDAFVRLAEPLPEEFKFGLDAPKDSTCEDCDPEAPCEQCGAFEAELTQLLESAKTLTQFVRVRESFVPPEIIEYPAALFAKPELRRLTPFQYDPSTGRLFGHLAGFRTCHGAMPECVTPPRSQTDYRYFANTPIHTKEGGRVWVGRLVCDTVHAKIRGINAEQAMAHYANTAAIAGLVAIGEDEHGIWISGAASPALDKERLTVALACPPSGDWRPWPGIVGKELIAALAVPVPGFNTPQAEFSGEGPLTGLIISNVPAEPPGQEGALTSEMLGKIDKIASFVERQMEREADLLARQMDEDRRRRVAALADSYLVNA